MCWGFVWNKKTKTADFCCGRKNSPMSCPFVIKLQEGAAFPLEQAEQAPITTQKVTSWSVICLIPSMLGWQGNCLRYYVLEHHPQPRGGHHQTSGMCQGFFSEFTKDESKLQPFFVAERIDPWVALFSSNSRGGMECPRSQQTHH